MKSEKQIRDELEYRRNTKANTISNLRRKKTYIEILEWVLDINDIQRNRLTKAKIKNKQKIFKV